MKKCLGLLIVILLVFSKPSISFAIDCEGTPPSGADKVDEINQYIAKCTEKVNVLKSEQLTLKKVISTINSQINLAQGQINQTQAQIEQLEKDIEVLGGVLDTVNTSMDLLSSIYIARVKESYKRYRVDPSQLIFSSTSFADYFTKIKYLNVVKAKDQIILMELEKSRQNYDQRKNDKVAKQKEIEALKTKLENQRRDLAFQQKDKQSILISTQNDEKKFQDLLSQARTELEAIEAVIAGKGIETEVGDIKAGQVIATIITGSSCNSSGSHLHFIVSENGAPKNPFDFLKGIEHENCSGSSCGSGDGDPFNPSGSWDWPISSVVRFIQGYGSTWAVSHYSWIRNIYSFHNGIDIFNSSTEVKAVKDGKLFRGSYTGGGGCALKYVRVDHADSNLDTFYLHVSYF